MSQQERDKNFGAPQNGDPFQDEDAVEVDYDPNELRHADDPSEGEATQDELEELRKRVKTLENTIDALIQPEKLQKWYDEPSIAVQLKNIELELTSLQDETAPKIEPDDIGKSKQDRIYKAILENFDELSYPAPKGRVVATSTPRGEQGIGCVEALNEDGFDLGLVQTNEVKRSFKRIAESLDGFDYVDRGKNKSKLLVMEDNDG